MLHLLRNYARLIRNRRYFPLWLAHLLSNLGDTLHYIALVVWVYQRTGSSLAVSGAVFFEVVPVILLAPIAGVVIDRFPRKAVLVGSDVIRAILVLALLFTTQLWHMYLIIFLLTAAGTFFNPAVSATLPTLLDDEDLLAANSVSWSTGASCKLSVLPSFLFNATTFLVSALLLLVLPIPAGREVKTRGWRGFLMDTRTKAYSLPAKIALCRVSLLYKPCPR